MMLTQSISLARSITPAQEQRRVAAHIRRAEDAAAARDVAALDPLTRLVRGLLLRELSRYREGGRFPKNRDHAEPTPYFVDAEGTRCAMAHLLEVGGEGELVAKIARQRNNAWVRELADEPRLLAWLAAAGLTVAEAAAIQPWYGCVMDSDYVCGGPDVSVGYRTPATGVLEGTVISVDAYRDLSTVRIDGIYGEGGHYAVGDMPIAYVRSATEGARVLLPVDSITVPPRDDGGASLSGVVFDAAGTYTVQGSSGPRSVSRELFLSAVQSSDCAGTLAEADPSWDDGCEGGGCSASGGGSPTTLGILLAIVAVMAARRALPRRSAAKP